MTYGRKERRYWIISLGHLEPDTLPLGSILGLPYAPDASVLNFGRIEPIEGSLIRPETEQAKFSITRAFDAGLGSKLEISTPLAPLLGAAPSLGCNFRSERVETIEARRFRVSTFMNPPDEYVDRALRVPEVLGYIKRSWFSAPVYMVVSVAVATLITKDHKTSKSFESNAGAGVSPPGTGVSLAAEISGSLGSGLHLSEATAEQDTILAYRVRRIRYERRKDIFKKDLDNDTKFGFFDADRQQEEEVEENEDDDSDIPGYRYSTEIDNDEAASLGFEDIGADSGQDDDYEDDDE